MEITRFRNCRKKRESVSILISLCLNLVCSPLTFEYVMNSTGKITGTNINYWVELGYKPEYNSTEKIC